MTTFSLDSQLCDVSASQLLVVDVQGRLAGAMGAADRERVIRNSAVLIKAAELLGVPLIASEQYPRGLGPTEEEVSSCFPDSTSVVEKTCFACTASEAFVSVLKGNERKQVVLTGMESHVCVLQTAMQLRAEGYAVFVVEDAVCSRQERHHRNAMERMRSAGIVVSNTESVLFEWLRDAAHEHFKAISALIK